MGLAATCSAAKGLPADLTPMSRGSFEHIEQVMGLYPAPALPGVDLTWHMDRVIEYMTNVLNREHEGLPYYFSQVYTGPARLGHGQWDAPHCVGRFLLATMDWEQATGRRVADQEAIHLLRSLLRRCISDADHLAHFYHPATGLGNADMHSQRETLLALVGLARVREMGSPRNWPGGWCRALRPWPIARTTPRIPCGAVASSGGCSTTTG